MELILILKGMTGKKLTFGANVLEFHKTLEPPHIFLKGIEVIRPHEDQKVWGYMEKFFNKFFRDTRNRVFVFGINPGRFGSGTTGIPFTDPVVLENVCGIGNTLVKRQETSSKFVYQFIQQWGGPHAFYRDFFLTAISPIGFIRNGVNCNYYDNPELFRAVRSFIVDTLTAQLAFGARRDIVIVLGSGKNQKVFNDMNQEYGWFEEIYAVEHPRFIMQYRRKYLKKYLKKYQDIFSRALLQKLSTTKSRA